MKIFSIKEILEVLEMPYPESLRTVSAEAKETHRVRNGDRALITALLGYDNVCRNQCTYCGMRAGFAGLTRFRLEPEQIDAISRSAREMGLRRLFLVSGEDPKFDFKTILGRVEYARSLGLHVSLGAGEFKREQYTELQRAGLDEYVLKFETADRELFARIKPSTTFEKRMDCIRAIRECGLKLASGNIVGLPHQSLAMVAEDILLMRELEISWAPIIPYMPVPDTPLAAEGGRGSLETTLKEIAILRLMMPEVNITAQQPGEDARNGLADFQGNLNALNTGANMLFVDMLPSNLVQDFHVLESRRLETLENVRRLVKTAGMREG